MAGLEVLSLGWSGTARASFDGVSFKLVDDVAAAPPVSKAAKLRLPFITEQVIGNMRDLVLCSFLGSQFAESEDRASVAQYTTETTRDAFPRRLAESLGECLTEGGESGRLPADYVAALARSTTRVVASETRPKKKGAILLGHFAYQDAHVIKAIARLAPEHGQWLRYAYGDSKVWDDEQGAVVALWKRAEPLFGKMQAKTLQRVRSLAHLAVQAGKSRMNSGREIHGSEKLMQLLQVKRGNFDVQWAPRWKLYADQLAQLDREALAALARALGDFEYIIEGRGLGPEVESGESDSGNETAARSKKTTGLGLETVEAAVLHISGNLLAGGSIERCRCTDIRPPAPGKSQWVIRAEPCAECDLGPASLDAFERIERRLEPLKPFERLQRRLERLREQLAGRGLVLELGQRFIEPK
jgi:hypothetical protein